MTTSSPTGPTATTCVRPVPDANPNLRRVTINEDEEVDVSTTAEEIYWMLAPDEIPDSAFKCGGCKLLTIHSGFEFRVQSHNASIEPIDKRLYCCSNCAKVSQK